ncbi:MAG: DNA polymerase III subunit gamma/tau [Candidatus Levybacteria bacterium]|nr:DNA polymerase III subunit gamma/tau [Candidatus Levybacteria bacterium]
MVYYRKYRPQLISELDNTNVRDALYSVLSKDPPHAFLFTGPKGLGKTSAARIVAKVINCTGRKSEARNSKSETNTKYKILNTKYQNIEPCNICEQCTTIANGTNLDVLEIDAASNRGIDEIRDLKDKIRLSPLRATKKVYIIDEVHMMTTEAFNALLKTLEEPPNHALFILCTTEKHKVPETIISRCFHINFTRATSQELLRSFKRIVTGEKLTIDQDALSQIARLSDGGFRDGAKILEELASHNKKITKELVEEKYQVSSITYQVSEMVDILSKKDVRGGIELVGNLVEQGVDIKYFLEQLIEALHCMLLEKVGIQDSHKSQVISPKLEIDDIKKLFELLTKASSDMRYTILPQLPLELAVIEWSQGEEPKKAQVSTPDVGDGMSLLHYSANGDMSQEWLVLFWKNFILKVKDYNHTLAGVLRGCKLASFDRKHLIIETAYTFHRERLDEGKTKDILDKIASDLTGNPVQVKVELKMK